MIRRDQLVVTTAAGLTLRLDHHHNASMRDVVCALLDLPLSRAQRERGALFGTRAAFLGGGIRTTDVYIDARDEKYPSVPPSLWLGNASIEIDDATASTVQAWLDSRAPYEAPAEQQATSMGAPA